MKWLRGLWVVITLIVGIPCALAWVVVRHFIPNMVSELWDKITGRGNENIV